MNISMLEINPVEHELFDAQTSQLALRVGVAHEVEFDLIATIIKRLHAEAPHAAILFSRHSEEDVMYLMRTGALSMSFNYNMQLRPGIQVQTLRRFAMKLVRSDCVPEAIDANTFCTREHAVVSSARNINNCVDAELERLGCQRRIAMEVPYYSCLTTVLPGTDLVAVVPDHIASSMVAGGGFRAEDLPIESQALRLSLAWPMKRDRITSEHWLRSRIRVLMDVGSQT